VSFFDGLADTLGRLAAEIPQYDALVKLCATYHLEPSPRLKSSLVNIYVELFRFLKTVAGIFLRENKCKISHIGSFIRHKCIDNTQRIGINFS